MAGDDRKSTDDSGDNAWLAALAGRQVDGVGDESTAADAREGRMMRTALRDWSPAVGDVDARDPARVARLIERAYREGLLPRPESAAPRRASFIDRLRAWADVRGMRPGLALAATLIVVATVTLVFRVERPDDVTVERSAPDGLILLRTADAEGARRTLTDALAADGIPYRTYLRFGRYGVDADLPRPLPAGVRVALDRLRIPSPADDVLRVEFESERR
jgi:hypothetical protein